MKKRIVCVLCALLLCMTVFLVSCDKGEMTLNKSMIGSSLLHSEMEAVELSAYESAVLSEREGVLTLWTRADMVTGNSIYIVYNIKTNKETGAYTYSPEELVQLRNQGHSTPVYIDDDRVEVVRMGESTPVYSYYASTGKVIAEGCEDRAYEINDCLQIGQTIYRLNPKNGEVKSSFKRTDFAGTIPHCDKWTNNYYYDFSGNTVSVYDNHYTYLCSYTIPSYAVSGGLHLFSDGYVVIQYRVKLDTMDTKYDIIATDGKYDLVTKRLNPANGAVENIETDYMLGSVATDSAMYKVFTEEMKTIVNAVKIRDHRIDTSGASTMILNVNSKFEGGRIGVYNGMNVIAMFYGNGYAAIGTSDGKHLWLFNADGNKVGEINGVTDGTDKFLIASNGIYNYELKLLSTFEAPNETYPLDKVGTLGNYIVFRGNTSQENYYLFDGKADEEGNMFHLIGETNKLDMRLTYGCYGIANESGNYVYYDAKGNELFTSYGKKATFNTCTADYTLVYAYNAAGNGYRYIRLSGK